MDRTVELEKAPKHGHWWFNNKIAVDKPENDPRKDPETEVI